LHGLEAARRQGRAPLRQRVGERFNAPAETGDSGV
jgi:hypothetical protein